MKKLVSMVIMMLLMTGISFGYTLTINSSGGTTTREVEAGKTVKVALSDRSPANYTVTSGNVVLKVIGNRRELVMPEGDVEIGIIRPGDYIAYQPSVTSYTVTSDRSGYTSNQTFNPSSVTSWKVFKNDSGNIEIISSESVGALYLEGKTGYIYAIDTLNNMCAAYVNSTYASSGRSLGYGNGPAVFDEATYPMTWEETYTNGNNGFPYADTYEGDDTWSGYNSEDRTIINTADADGAYPLRHSDPGDGTYGYVWLASRDLHTSGGPSSFVRIMVFYGSSFFVRGMHSDGYVDGYNLYSSGSDGSEFSYSSAGGVRPVVSLKSGIKIIGGDGSSENPWKISI